MFFFFQRSELFDYSINSYKNFSGVENLRDEQKGGNESNGRIALGERRSVIFQSEQLGQEIESVEIHYRQPSFWN